MTAPSRRSRESAPLTVAALGLLSVVSLTLLSAAVIDIPRQWTVRGISGLGVVTVGITVLGAMALLIARTLPQRAVRVLSPWLVMLLWALASIAWAPPGRAGLQTGAVLVSFGVLALVAAAAMRVDQARTEGTLVISMRLADAIGLGIVVASLALRGWPTNIDAVPWFVHPRALALFGLVPISWHLARWVAGNERSAIPAVLWVLALFASLSRLATATALLLVLLAGLLRARQGGLQMPRRTHLLMLLLVPGVLAAVLTVGPFRARITAQDKRGRPTAELQLRDNGREQMWDGVARSAAEAPVLGKGLGSSELAVSETYYWVGHPHNEYLRMWHDLGLPGLVLMLLTLVSLGRAWWKQLARPVQQRMAPPPLPLAAAGVLLALITGSLTDNPLVYGFVMAPSAIVTGAALGSGVRRRRRRARAGTSAAPDVEHVLADDGVIAEDVVPEPDGEVRRERVRVRVRKRRRS